jgi:hypothetical protein
MFMATLPIATSVGPAAVYFAVRRPTKTVTQDLAYPDTGVAERP